MLLKFSDDGAGLMKNVMHFTFITLPLVCILIFYSKPISLIYSFSFLITKFYIYFPNIYILCTRNRFSMTIYYFGDVFVDISKVANHEYFISLFFFFWYIFSGKVYWSNLEMKTCSKEALLSFWWSFVFLFCLQNISIL